LSAGACVSEGAFDVNIATMTFVHVYVRASACLAQYNRPFFIPIMSGNISALMRRIGTG